MQNSNDDFSDSNINRNVWLSQTSAQSLPSRTINVPPSGLIDNTNGRNSNSVDKTLTQYHQNGVINEKNPMKINVKSRNDDDYDDEDNGDTISRLIGHYGLYQFGWTIFIILFQIPSAFHIFSFMFQTIDRDFWCARPDNLSGEVSIAQWRNLTQPNDACTIRDISQIPHADDPHSIISHLMTNNTKIPLIPCTRFEFDPSISGDTLQSEWNYVCDKSTLLSFVEMCFLAGAAIGSLTSGYLSDEYGRRHSLMIFVALQASIGTGIAYSNSVVVFMILRFIIGFTSMSVVNISFVLTVELVSGKWTTIIGILDILPLPLSYILITGIAYVTRNWRTLQLCISSPWFALLLLWYFLPESPRWLLAKQRIDELRKIIETAAKWNRRKLPDGYEKDLYLPQDDASEREGSFADLFKPQYRKTTMMFAISWYAMVLLYMAVTLHLSEMGGDIYANAAIAGLVEAVSIILSIYVVLKLGVQRNIVTYTYIAGIACLLLPIVPNESIVIALAMIIKCTTGVTNAVIPLFTTCQYPTVLRTRSIGISNFSAGIALITVPYIWLLKNIAPYLPSLLMGICGIIGATALLVIKDNTANIMRAERLNERRANIVTVATEINPKPNSHLQNSFGVNMGIGNSAFNPNEP